MRLKQVEATAIIVIPLATHAPLEARISPSGEAMPVFINRFWATSVYDEAVLGLYQALLWAPNAIEAVVVLQRGWDFANFGQFLPNIKISYCRPDELIW